MFINHSSKQVTAKIVYYGPGLSGKTTNLQYIFSITNPKTRGELISIETKIERTLFFDLLPINVGLINGYQTKFQLYTVPGQIFYNSTRKLVLKGADGIVFVADSQELMKTANLDSLENLSTNLADHKQDISQMPLVFQYNKRDLANTLPVDELNRTLNEFDYPYFSAVAVEGRGVIETLRKISGLILKKIKSLLEQEVEEPQNAPAVDFDTNGRQKIIERVNLPYKRIPADNFDNSSVFKVGEYEKIGENKSEEKDGEEVLKVETVEPVEPFALEDIEKALENETLEEIKIDEEPEAVEPIEKMMMEVEEIKKSPEVGKKKIQQKTAGLDLLEQLKDKTRITVIKKIPASNPQLFIDIKDKDYNLLESIKVDMTQETKKVTLILDVKGNE